ncbi:cilia- and flagella-associated protein 99 isoform X3 [Hemibagrus wyckioides]|uniref:cilia- and flagella-associated protein 99 isoform X3 n=1 Tax=Hemibagrus wyckioides TaxID=337641 RepID=UPI00266D20ED|nr:cilia- and flagella-associated protein 99 isoform X3 [Hemibagrus wyckioides]
MNYKELVREAIKLLDEYEPDKQCVDTFMEDSAKTLANRPSAEQIFITDTVYGCIAHQKLLDVVINVFYNQKGKYFLKADRNQFVVVSYLAMFHLEDLGLEQFSIIIKSLDCSKMYKVPASTHKAPKEQQVLEDVKQKNHLKSQKVLYEANTQQFRCANPEKSEKTKSIMSQIQQNRKSKLQFDSVYSSGTPATHKTNTLPIRLNTTAILREGALYNRQMEEELNRLEHLMQGTNEPSAFLQWQKEMKEKDLQEELVQLERRRLEGKISHEEALLARQRVLELNQHKALLKKEETAQLMRRYAEKRLREEKEMKELVQLVADGHKNSKAAKVKLQEIKKRIVKEVSEQSQELLRQALEEAQAELSRKFELIRQIRAIESVPHLSQKFVDDTETGGHELLCEMSLAELRERLARLKEEEQQEQEKRRQRILEEKQSREQLLIEQLDAITACRTAAGQATAQKQEEKKLRLKLQEAVSMDERVVALQRTLGMKQQERQKRKETEKAKSKLNEQMAVQNVKSYSHEKQVLEKEHWLQLEQALEKQVQREASKKNTSGLTQGIAT